MLNTFKHLLRKNKTSKLCHIYTTEKGGDDMVSHDQIEALANSGLLNDRYSTQKGYWHPVESCQVTLISLEDINHIEKKSKLSMQNGLHRRNLVISNIPSRSLEGKTFQLGSAIFKYDKPRPPCGYIDSIAGKGVAKTLGRHSGICLHVIKGGSINVGDRLIFQ